MFLDKFSTSKLHADIWIDTEDEVMQKYIGDYMSRIHFFLNIYIPQAGLDLGQSNCVEDKIHL